VRAKGVAYPVKSLLLSNFKKDCETDCMKHLLTLIVLASISVRAHADIFAVFREQDGSTNWQYIANTSASLLIIILLIVLTFLVRAHRRAMRSNRALTEIKATLEDRVAQRTANCVKPRISCASARRISAVL
jgi:C4-dicarboxylate-specific signal transduction histidine kinase